MKRGILIHHGSRKSDIDIAAFMRKERETDALSKVPNSTSK